MLKFSHAIVTGGSSGIGAALVNILLDDGAEVITLSRTQGDFSGHRKSENLWQISCDICDEDQLKAAFQKISDKWDHCDVLFSNAGFGISGTVASTEKSQMIKQFDVNYFSAVSVIQNCLPLLRRGKYPRIVLTSSVAGEISIPYQSFYSASKASLNMLALALNTELKSDEIKTIAVMPGDCRTDFTDKREKNPETWACYERSEERSISKMEEDERNGYAPEFVASQLYRYAGKRRPKALYGVGTSYRILLTLYKLLPLRLTTWIVSKMYG
ncbi:MAG: SDR family NAD(P)-dependent oxidoreductase [Eubacteriales bacterium]|nr:SDR family NAD(P)-dependent oxidoreductase [Eubacteriales bacterium]MDD4324313.1 SDR family NAD(P)-dependent oxidoreductase [Eubacteriales bacterium]MDD4540851.1 SDR family NAD(P)-dependent oxidoreductase [Eubacteriales bacterium]